MAVIPLVFLKEYDSLPQTVKAEPLLRTLAIDAAGKAE
jgi:hypothetical protein